MILICVKHWRRSCESNKARDKLESMSGEMIRHHCAVDTFGNNVNTVMMILSFVGFFLVLGGKNIYLRLDVACVGKKTEKLSTGTWRVFFLRVKRISNFSFPPCCKKRDVKETTIYKNSGICVSRVLRTWMDFHAFFTLDQLVLQILNDEKN